MTNKDKLVAWDGNFYSELSDEITAICLTEKQRYIVGQAMRQVRWSTRWRGDVSLLDLDEIASEIELKIDGHDCECGGGTSGAQCFDLQPSSSAFTFYPNDPYVDPENSENAPVLSFMRWSRWGSIDTSTQPQMVEWINEIGSNITGYFPSDVMLVPEIQNFFQSPIEQLQDLFTAFTTFPLPFVKLKVNGAVEVEIDLLKIPFGGLAYIIPDFDLSINALWETIVEIVDNDGEPPNFWSQAELNRDVFAVPPELDTVVKKEIVFDTDKEHTIHIVFVPQINDEFPYYFAFGGIRSIEICGGTAIDPNTDEEIDHINYGDEIFIREGVVPMSTIQDICEGVICAIEKSASRFLSGQAGNTIGSVTIGADGTITVSSDGVAGSSGGTAQEQKSGGTFKVASELNIMFNQIQDWICVTAVGTATTKLYFKSLYGVTDETDADTFIDNVVAYLGGCGGGNWFEVLVDELSEAMFCGGVNKSALSAAIIEYGADANKIALMLEAVSIIADTQLNLWYVEGIEIPLSEYLAYACYKRDNVVLDYTAANYVAQTNRTVVPVNWVFDHYRAVRITVTGKFVSAGTVGKEQDLFWYKADENTAPVLANDVTYFRTSSSAPSKNLYPTSIPSYSESGVYSFTIVVPPNQFGNYIQLYWVSSEKIPDATGQMDLLFEDLGKVV